jgi:hypothetical protein
MAVLLPDKRVKNDDDRDRYEEPRGQNWREAPAAPSGEA